MIDFKDLSHLCGMNFSNLFSYCSMDFTNLSAICAMNAKNKVFINDSQLSLAFIVFLIVGGCAWLIINKFAKNINGHQVVIFILLSVIRSVIISIILPLIFKEKVNKALTLNTCFTLIPFELVEKLLIEKLMQNERGFQVINAQ